VNSQDYDKLRRQLNHQFENEALLKIALTHRSYGANNNERLEFLGDSILNFCIAESLFHRFQSAPEGDLSRVRAALVKGETLASIARELNLGSQLRLGEGELRSGGSERDSILADAVEAIIGAIYLDAGMDAARQEIMVWYADRLDKVCLSKTGKDPKTRLQEYLQALGKSLPQYKVVNISGEAHAQQFMVGCHVAVTSHVTTAKASSRRAAEKLAAEKMLEHLQVD
jgi:ribonuclease-3